MSLITRHHMDATVTNLPLDQLFDLVRNHEKTFHTRFAVI